MAKPALVSVVIPTFRRKDQLDRALRSIFACEPAPAEVIVHVDAGDDETRDWLGRCYPQVACLQSAERMGPGGGRNKLVAAARYGVVASFDDDSYPLDADYFLRTLRLFELRPDAAAIASRIFHRGETVQPAVAAIGSTADFVGCGVAYRKDDFLEAGGYVPLPVAYGMEEVDLSLRLSSRGKRLYYAPWLRVFHDTDLSHHATPAITAASIANLALLAFLRYPLTCWPYGLLQVANRVLWLVRARRVRGVITGLLAIPQLAWRHRSSRRPVSRHALSAFIRSRRETGALEPLA